MTPPAPGEDPPSQRQRWRRALARQARLSRGRGQHRRRPGLGAVDGPGRVRVVLPGAAEVLGDASRSAADASADAGRDRQDAGDERTP